VLPSGLPRPRRVALALFLTLAIVGASTPAIPATAAAGSRVTWQGASWYLQGANVPWFNWGCDFGCGISGGASDPAVQSQLRTAFSSLQASGAHVARWWVFPGDASHINRDASGTPTGLSANVFRDFDAAVALAAEYDLYYDFVLFSAPSHIPASWQTNATQRSALANVLSPLFARYRGNPRVLSWEIYNEPEFDIWNGAADQGSVQATVRTLANAVHANSSAYVTVGSAMLDGLPMWVGQGLDYYQAHWYDYMSGGNWCARCTDYATVRARYGLDGPLVIGEMYAGPDVDAQQRFVDFYNKGFAGAWPWSLFPSHTSDGMRIDMTAMSAFASARTDLGPRGGGSTAPTSTPTTAPTRTPLPTTVPTRTPVPTPTSTAPQTVTFDGLSNPNRPLNGSYPNGVIDWGTNAWYLSGPWGAFRTNSIGFNGPGPTSASFTFSVPRRLIRVDAYNGGRTSSTISLSCAGQTTRQVTLAVRRLQTIDTGWTGACSPVTVRSTNGWDTNFDTLVIQ
jgi:hypothetical protein